MKQTNKNKQKGKRKREKRGGKKLVMHGFDEKAHVTYV